VLKLVDNFHCFRDLASISGLVITRLFDDCRAMEIVCSVTKENDGGYVTKCHSAGY